MWDYNKPKSTNLPSSTSLWYNFCNCMGNNGWPVTCSIIDIRLSTNLSLSMYSSCCFWTFPSPRSTSPFQTCLVDSISPDRMSTPSNFIYQKESGNWDAACLIGTTCMFSSIIIKEDCTYLDIWRSGELTTDDASLNATSRYYECLLLPVKLLQQYSLYSVTVQE